MTGLRIFLLGPPRVELDETAVTITRRKALAMLLYLAVRGQPHSRDALATLFYPDHSQSKARAYLRRDLAVVNTPLGGDWLDVDRETVELKPGFWSDVEQFRRLQATGRQHDHPPEVICPACIEALSQAIALYNDDFLAGFTLRDCPEFDDWQFFQAESLRQELATALERAVAGCRGQGQPEVAIPYARRWVALDPLHEPAQRALMQVYDRAGQSAAALRQYEEYKTLLEEELGLPPEEETTTLYEAIKAKRLLSGYLKVEETRPRPSLQPERPSVSRQAPPPPETELEARAITPTGSDEMPRVVGREQELQQLHIWLNKALAGNRQVVFVTGEAGAGKTTLIEAFIEQARREQAILRVGHGQCIEHRGVGEAYMPVLEALGRMCREPDGQALITLLARAAPTWLIQMPWLVSAEELAHLQEKVLVTTRERMLREMVEAMEMMTAEWPVVLVLEDLHWSDYSTLDLLTRLAQRQESARLLVIGTYRPADVKLADHPLHTVVAEMGIRRQCSELALAYLTEAAIVAYLAGRFPGHHFPATLATLLHQRTGGNPLFLRTVVDFWVAQEAVVRVNGQWRLEKELATLAVGVPEQLRSLVEQQLRRLPPEDQQILEAAGVVGMTFSAAVVAATVEMAVETIESRCTLLARRGLFLRSSGVAEWPDGMVAERFEFIHHLYQEALYERVSAGRRVRLHRQIGKRLEIGYGAAAAEMAAELALHFLQGHASVQAIIYLRFAAQQAMQRNAYREAIEHLRQALDILARQPDLPGRDQHELSLQLLLGPALIMTQGWASVGAEQAYSRARDLCYAGDTRQLATTLYGLATVYELRGQYAKTQKILEEQLRLSRDPQNTRLQLESHELLACSTFHQGAFREALNHAEQALTFCNPNEVVALTPLLGEDPSISSYHWAGLALWFLGYPDQALARSRTALNEAKDFGYSFGLAHAQQQAAMIHQLRREASMVEKRAEKTINAATQGGFTYWVGVGEILRGWSLAVEGQTAAGIAHLHEGLDICQQTGATIDHPYFLSLLAEAHGRAGQMTQGLDVLAEALALANDQKFFHKAELYRLQGVLLWQANLRKNEAETSLQQALDLARQQQAKSLELRAAISLSHLWQEQGQSDKARQMLGEIYGWFSEGFETADLQKARALLDRLEAK